jgi:hypothetical protein
VQKEEARLLLRLRTLGKSLENDVPWIDLRNLLQETIGFYL